MLITAGLQLPVILFEDVAGNDGATLPSQIEKEAPKLKLGATIGFTVTAKLVVVAHCPALGVNV